MNLSLMWSWKAFIISFSSLSLLSFSYVDPQPQKDCEKQASVTQQRDWSSTSREVEGKSASFWVSKDGEQLNDEEKFYFFEPPIGSMSGVNFVPNRKVIRPA